jgi:hypothetical protein
MNKILMPKIPTVEESKANRQKWLDECPWVPREHEFNYVSLLAWLDLCGVKNIPAIEGNKIDSVETRLLMQSLDGVFDPQVKQFFRNSNKYLQENPHNMLRWDCCASYSIKYAMSEKGIINDTDKALELDDPRFIDILYLWRDSTISIVGRPWIIAEYFEGWPVEFRTYVQDKKVIGVSNYYPQRNLSDKYKSLAEKCIELTEKLDYPAISFTADWLVTPFKEILFLEGGPPFTPWGGAHPCCFKPSEIEGIALSNRNKDMF